MRHWATRWGRSRDTTRRKSRRYIPALRPVLDDGAALIEQLFVLNGRFNVASVSADHDTARRIAEQCLELASRHPQSKALAKAHRIMGHMDWAQGQFVEARAHLEQCLAISFSDQVARDHSRTFVQDVIFAAWGYTGFR